MSDVAFNGLGSFVLFLFYTILFGLVLLLFIIRQVILNSGTEPKAKKMNLVFIKSATIPFFMGISGLIALQILDVPAYQKMFDDFLAFVLVGLGLFIGITWLIIQLRTLSEKTS